MTQLDDTTVRREQALEVLRGNDRGGYTIPTDGLYPFQWNWDSGFSALGWVMFDEPRAWRELERLFEGQWSDGMVPHIIFHDAGRDYFPGPDVWRVDRIPPTSGISQPPVLAVIVRSLLARSRDSALAESEARALYPKLLASHRWWARARDPEGTGLVAILHPWESGMDNSPAWDAALERVRTVNRNIRVRRNTPLRPREQDYEHYLLLVERFRDASYDPERLYLESPFRMVDVGLNAILHRAERDLLILAESFGTAAEREEISDRLTARERALDGLWDSARRLYLSFDGLAGERVNAATSAGFLPLFAGVPDDVKAAAMGAEIERWSEHAPYRVPSVAPDGPEFQPRHYWRGPVWPIVNWMISDGLAGSGQAVISERIRDDTRRMIEGAGFAEYFDPRDGAGLGGDRFSWNAALYLFWAGRIPDP